MLLSPSPLTPGLPNPRLQSSLPSLIGGYVWIKLLSRTSTLQVGAPVLFAEGNTASCRACIW